MSKEVMSLSRVRKINYNVINRCSSKTTEIEKREHWESQGTQSAQAELGGGRSLKAKAVHHAAKIVPKSSVQTCSHSSGRIPIKVRATLSIYFAFSFLMEERAIKQIFSYDSSHKLSIPNPYVKFICSDRKRSSSFAVVYDLQIQDKTCTFSTHKYLQMPICVYRQTLISVYSSELGKPLVWRLDL